MRKEIEHKCLNCNKLFITRETKSKYCTRSCSAINANKRRLPPSEEQKRKASISLKKWWESRLDKELKKKEIANLGMLSQKEKHKKPDRLLDLSKRTISKICRRLNLSCSRCQWSEDICDIHHILSRKDGGSDSHDNLSYLCPNCHRLAGNGKIKADELITLKEFIGDKWLEYYYG